MLKRSLSVPAGTVGVRFASYKVISYQQVAQLYLLDGAAAAQFGMDSLHCKQININGR